jgi:hypothetical protein
VRPQIRDHERHASLVAALARSTATTGTDDQRITRLRLGRGLAD